LGLNRKTRLFQQKLDRLANAHLGRRHAGFADENAHGLKKVDDRSLLVIETRLVRSQEVSALVDKFVEWFLDFEIRLSLFP
jgi:hypothetical protein